MASIIKRKLKGSVKYYIAYRIKDGSGKQKQMRLLCDDKKEALLLLEDVTEAEKANNEYIRPKAPHVYSSPTKVNDSVSQADITISELLDRYAEHKCAEDWQAGTSSTSESITRNYIKPIIGDVTVRSVTAQFVQRYYDDLPNHPQARGNHKNGDQRNVSARTVREVHKILRPAFNMAATMGIITVNPTLPVSLPKQPKYKRAQWSENEFSHAISLCSDIQLRLFMVLMMSGTLRSGELSGLTWDDIDTSDTPYIDITKSVRRLKLEDIKKTKERSIIYIFPNQKANAKSATVIKDVKTEESVRRVFLPASVAKLLVEYKAFQDKQIAEVGDYYQDYGFNFVFCHLNGRPMAVKTLAERFKAFVKQKKLREVDPYSLRHSGSTAKLRATGNIKAVQGDMGHATAEMLTKVYAAIVDEDRVNNAIIMEERLFSKLDNKQDDSAKDASK